VLAKGLGGGIPLGALVAHKDVCCFEHGDQGGTFNGNAFATAVGCAVMEEIGRLGFLQQVTQNGIYLAGHLDKLSRKHGCGELRGRGLLLVDSISDQWDWYPNQETGGKVVWATVTQ